MPSNLTSVIVMATRYLNTKMHTLITIHAGRNAKTRMIVNILEFGIPLFIQPFAGDGIHVTNAILQRITI